MVKKSLLARFFSRGTARVGVEELRGVNRVAEKVRDRAAAGDRRAPAAEAAPAPVKPTATPAAVPARGPAPTREDAVAARPSQPAAVEQVTRPAPAPVTPVEATAVSRDAEIKTSIQQGLQGISTVLDGIDRKIDKQQKTSEELMVSVRRLPEIIKDAPDASRAGLELLARISSVLENQGRATSELLQRVSDLPGAVASLQQNLNEQVGELARAHKNVDKTMHDTQRQLSNAFQEVRKTVDHASAEQDKKQQRMIEELHGQQTRQDRRVEELLQRQASATKMVVFLLVISIVALLLVVRQVSG